MEPDVRYCTTADGVRIAYTVTGEGPPHLFASGGTWSHVQLERSHPVLGPLFAELARHNTLVRFDSRGSGLSDRVLPVTIDDFVLDMEAVVGRVGLGAFALTAIQSSSPSAITFAARHREGVTRLVLIDGLARAADFLETPQVRAVLAAAQSDFLTATEAVGTLVFGTGRDESRDLGAYIRSCIGPDYFASAQRAATWGASEAAAAITAPTLILHHRDNQMITDEMVRDLASRIPDARLAVVDGLWADDPVGLAVRIADFINAGEAPPSRRDSAPASGVRTVLFTDIVGHTEMMSRLGDAAGRDVLREHERITRETLRTHGGTEIKTMGDGFMASFGSVTAAVDCAVALQRAISNIQHPTSNLQIRVGLNAGEPIEEDGDLFGQTVILASRICAQAGPGEILIPEPVRHLLAGKDHTFADRGDFAPKGFDDAVRLYEVRWRD